MVKVKEIVAHLKNLPPADRRKKTYPIGLQLGSLEHEVKK